MKKMYMLFLTGLFLWTFNTNSYGQCNKILIMDLIGFSAVIPPGCVGGVATYEITVNIIISGGNPSVCIKSTTDGGLTYANELCWNNPTNTNGEMTFTFEGPCDAEFQFAGWTNPDGGGTICTSCGLNPPFDCPPLDLSNPLPVELVSFKAYLSNDEVITEWVTASEENNDYFELQTSTNGKRFEKLATIDGRGTTDELQYYKYIHTKPVRGNNYYRIKQVDFDGKFEIFDIKVVKIKSMDKVTVYPSQVYDVITLELPNVPTKDMEIRIYNSTGILMQTGTLLSDDYKISFQVSDFPSGVYFIRYVNEELDYTSKQFFKMVD